MFHSEIDGDSKLNNLDNWNGKVNNTGADAPAGEYYYNFKYKTKADPDKQIETKGIITLIRSK